MATVHLVCGFLGAGKTTFSKRLAAEAPAVHFNVDELYLTLFAKGPTYEVDVNAMDRLLTALNLLWPRVAAAGTDVVLDFGFWRRALRNEVRELARAAQAETRLHFLECSDEVALARCLKRNGQPGAFLISAEGFHELKNRFEPPSADERPTRVPAE